MTRIRPLQPGQASRLVVSSLSSAGSDMAGATGGASPGTTRMALEIWLAEYNEVRSHQGRWCYGKKPMQTFLSSLPLAREKVLQAQ
jgi:hypothetical protein